MLHRTRQAIVRWAAAVLLMMAVVYPLSYAPVVNQSLQAFESQKEPGVIYCRFAPIDGEVFPAYKPVDWLIDHTPLDKPLFAWARIWGVEDEFRWGAAGR